jgi:Carbohydrate phosphorylase/Carbohydrate-binding module 48 (Isoamylase N-terminal domain)
VSREEKRSVNSELKFSGFKQGASAPLGATVYPGGVDFSVFSKNATLVELLLFDAENAAQPAKVIPLDSRGHRTYHYWHVFVPGLKPGQIYGYRAQGPFALERGLWFDSAKVLLDPYGLVVAVPESYNRRAASRPGDNAAVAMKSVVADRGRYDWGEDLPLRRPFAETVIYGENEPETRAALDLIFSNHFNRNEPGIFEPLREALLTHGDYYMHLADLKSYLEADGRLCQLYADSAGWARKAILNIAGSGKFSSDRTIAEYAAHIWNVKPCPVE